jgi:retinol dehydrogenase 12
VNHLATAQLAILLLPLLLRTASNGTTPRLVFVSSASHHSSPPLKPPTSDQGILDWLNDPSTPIQLRYPVSKLLNLFFARELASRLPGDSPLVVNAVNPGFCVSSLRRNIPSFRYIIYWFMETFISWSAERGSRQLIFAALGNQSKPDEMKGAYISSSQIVEPSDYVISGEGAEVQKQLWVRALLVLASTSFHLIWLQYL